MATVFCCIHDHLCVFPFELVCGSGCWYF